ncbi:MAG: hypothetical protein ABIR30_06085 [Chitinophagaceae bacterium]
MKKIILCAAIFCSVAAINNVSAQVSINVNLGSQPAWGPSGYDHVDYYYLPDIETYYYVPTRKFIYLSGGNWVFASGLPPAYRSYNLYSGYKVVVNQPKAYLYYPTHKVKYAKYKGNRGQTVIVQKPKSNGHDNGNRGGKSKGRH